MGAFGSYGLSLFGAMLSHFDKFEEAVEYSSLALDLAENPSFQEAAPGTIKVVYLCVYAVQKPLIDGLDAMLRAYEIAKSRGDIEIAAYCLQGHAMFGLAVGMPLENLEKEMIGYCDFCREFRQEAVLMEILPFLQLTMNLLGKSENPLLLSGAGMKEDEFVARIGYMKEGLGSIVMMIYARVLLLFLLDGMDLADTERRKVTPKGDFIGAYFMKLLNYAFSALICISQARRKVRQARWFKREATGYMKALKKYAIFGSGNLVPLLTLIQAEMASLDGEKSNDALRDYDLAISMAGRSGFRHGKAIACEKAGEHMLRVGDTVRATDYLQQSAREFAEYQAYEKLRQMSHKYKGIVEIDSSAMSSSNSGSSRRLQPHIVEPWKQKV